MTTRILYVAGLGRSGSTLLTRLLEQVEGVCSVGELHHLWKTGAPRAAADELCGCGRTHAECGVWPARLAAAHDGQTLDVRRMQELADRVARIRHIRRLESGGDSGFEEAVEEYAAFWSRLYSGMREETGAALILDSSKDLGPLFFLHRVEGIEVRVLHLVRDVRGVAYSWSRKKLRTEFVDREIYMNRHGVFDVALRWWYSNLLAERSARLFPASMRLRYEDLVESPREVLERVCEFAGLSQPDLGFLEGHVARLAAADHSLSGNPMRFEGGELAIRSDTRWRERMGFASRCTAGALTWALLRRYGYLGTTR